MRRNLRVLYEDGHVSNSEEEEAWQDMTRQRILKSESSFDLPYDTKRPESRVR